MDKINTLYELYRFLRDRKKWWLAPIIILLAFCGGLFAALQTSAVAPLIYTIF